jgi:CRISPR-associated protein Csx10
LVLSGEVRYLNAYPAVEGRRSVPTPVSLRRPKYPGKGPQELIDLASFDGRPDPTGHPTGHAVAGRWPDQQLGGTVPRFLTVDDAEPSAADVRVSGRMHHQRDRTRGRAWTDRLTGETHGTIFGYEAIDAGQDFAGVLVLDTDGDALELAERLQALMSGRLLLGRSRLAGYGGDAVVLSWQALRRREFDHGVVVSDTLEPGTVFRALLTSPYLGRHATTGQSDPTYFGEDLIARLARAGAKVSVLYGRWAFTTAGGYNRTWGLPLPQQAGLVAGSVVVLRAASAVSLSSLLEVEHRGLGERRLEGYGRVVFLPEPTPTVVVAQGSPPPVQVPTAAPTPLVARIDRAVAADRIRFLLEEEAARVAQAALPPLPSPSLLARLRVPMRSGSQSALAQLRDWLTDAVDEEAGRSPWLRRPARDQLARCRVVDADGAESVALGEWLRAMANDEDGRAIAATLQVDAVARAACIGPPESLQEHLRSPAFLAAQRAALVDATLASLQRRRKLEDVVTPGSTGRDVDVEHVDA